MAKTIRFNTGRLYSAQGQRITATHYADGVVTFQDHDRNIDGEFLLIQGTFDADAVMGPYDSATYNGTARSRRDAVTVNAKP